jgi:hypothetical protein
VAFRRAAQRAFISWESLLRPAGVIPPFFCPGAVAGVPALPAFTLAHRALAAAAIFARDAADICLRPFPVVESEEIVRPSSVPSRFSSVSICLRIDSASSSELSDIYIIVLIC